MRNFLFMTLLALGACKSNTDTTKADNTARNEKVRENGTPTADNAVNNSNDLETTQKIRKAIVDDSTLSTNAHNAKVVVKGGAVTLAGPVASLDEKNRIEQIAISVVGDKTKVSDQLEVNQ